MITYNHEKYIRQAINSVLMQQGDFDLELHIVNDDSTDNTDQIITEIIESNKSNVQIHYINNKTNKGIVENFIFCLKQCKGDFIALCEGDDYWISNNKIEKQLKAINKNQDLVMVAHKSNVISDYINLKSTIIPNYTLHNNYILFKDILNPFKPKPCHTSSYFIRTNKLEIDKLYDCIKGDAFGDTPLIALLSTKGNILLLDEVLSTYRIHKNGFSNQSVEENIQVTKSFIDIFTKMSRIIDVKYQIYINKAIRISNYKLASLYSVLGNKNLSKKHFKLSLWDSIYYMFHSFKSYILLVSYCFMNEHLYKWILGKYRILSGKSV
ncbi:MAG: glycosyltransferase [Bacteroidota bacterium]